MSAHHRTGLAVVGFLWVAFALNYLDRQMVFAMFPALQAEVGFTNPQLGLVGSIFMWVYTLAMPLAGWLADRWRRDWMILASLVLWSLATLASGLSHSVGGFLAWRAVMGITESLYYPAAMALLAGLYAEAVRSRALSLHQSAQLAGVVAGGWYGGWMADHTGWRAAFVVAAIAGFAYLFVLAWALKGKEPPREPVKQGGGSVVAIVRSRCFLSLALAFSAFCAMLWMFYAWLPAYLYERFQLSMTESGWNATVFVQVSCAVGVVSGGWLADRLLPRWPSARFLVAAGGILLSAPFAYLTFSSASLDWVRFHAAAFGGFAGLMIANVFAASYDVVPGSHRGMSTGLLNMTGGISSAIMIYLAGLWKESVGFPTMMLWVMVISIAAATLVLLVAAWEFHSDQERAGLAGARPPAQTTGPGIAALPAGPRRGA